MPKKLIALTGIVRNQPDVSVADGAAHEIINLRPRDGAYRPVGRKKSYPSIPLDVRFIHAITDEIKVYIGTHENFISYWIEQAGVLSDEVVTTVASAEDMSFASMFKALMVNNNDLNIKYLFLFDINTMSYRIFDKLVPDLPYVSFQRDVKDDDDDTKTRTMAMPSEADPSLLIEDIQDLAVGVSSKLLSDMQDKGYLCGKYLVRTAWELFDGTIVMHSLPSVVEVSTLEGYADLEGVDAVLTYASRFFGYKLQYKVNITSDDLEALKTKYEGIVKSMNIYLTDNKGVINPNLDSVEMPWRNMLDAIDPLVTDNIDWINNCMMYYRFQQISLSDLTADEFTDVQVKDVKLLNTNPVMTVGNFACHTIYGKSLFAYNERLWLGNVLNTLYAGNLPYGFLQPCPEPETWTPYYVGLVFELSTGDGTKRVFSGWRECNLYLAETPGHFYFLFKDAMGYPDSRARSCTWYIKDPSGTIRLLRNFSLTSVPEMNFSYSLGLEKLILAAGYPGFHGDFADFTEAELPEVNGSYWDYNRIQASELDNPFYYPAINSYRVGLATVLGMSVNVIALSQGQVGQFPIYVFCSDGIWTLNIGTGELLVNTITPLSREVCNNPKSITSIDGGSAFTTVHGLFIISGAQVTEISEAAEGNHISKITAKPDYAVLAGNEDYYDIMDALCGTDFKSYLSGAIIAYDHTIKEIIISNSDYEYSWVFSLKFKSWFKISESWDRFVPDFFRRQGGGDAITADRADITIDSTELTADAVSLPGEFLTGAPATYGYRTAGSSFESKLGYHYNYPAVIDSRDIAPEGWHVPTRQEVEATIADYCGGNDNGGGALKDIGLMYWNSPNTGAEDLFGFSMRGNGMRNADGSWVGIKILGSFLVKDGNKYKGTAFIVYNTNTVIGILTDPVAGFGVRLFKDDAVPVTEMIGNDGKRYRCTTIGSRVMTAVNICETKYRLSTIIKTGPMYNQYVVLDPRGIAPAGYHVPTMIEFDALRIYAGISTSGHALREVGTAFWNSNTGATNSTGFSGRGTGLRDYAFDHYKEEGYWWSSTPGNYLRLVGGEPESWIGGSDPWLGMCLRYVKDDASIDEGIMKGNNGRTYRTGRIGAQVWVLEDVYETKFRNGDDIPVVSDSLLWPYQTTAAMSHFENDPNFALEEVGNDIPEVSSPSAWAALDAGARCSYNNDSSLALIGETTAYNRYDLTDEDFSELISVHFESRPLKLSASPFKSLNRMLIDGQVFNNIMNNLTYLFRISLFGTTDNNNWFLLNNLRTFNAGERLLIGRTDYSNRYYILLIGGRVDREAYFLDIEVDLNEKYGNKLR